MDEYTRQCILDRYTLEDIINLFGWELDDVLDILWIVIEPRQDELILE